MIFSPYSYFRIYLLSFHCIATVKTKLQLATFHFRAPIPDPSCHPPSRQTGPEFCLTAQPSNLECRLSLFWPSNASVQDHSQPPFAPATSYATKRVGRSKQPRVIQLLCNDHKGHSFTSTQYSFYVEDRASLVLLQLSEQLQGIAGRYLSHLLRCRFINLRQLTGHQLNISTLVAFAPIGYRR